MMDGISAASTAGSNISEQSRQFQSLVAAQSNQARDLLQIKLANTHKADLRMARQQLETLHINADRALANETSTRAVDEMFSKFSLLQKIMQSMG